MEYRYLGKTGVKISTICLGTMTFSLEGSRTNAGARVVNKAKAFALLDEFASRGGNFIDTADVYHEGESEKVVGDWLSTVEREKFVIATKVRFGSGDLNYVGLSRKNILRSIDESLARLKTSYVDLYQIHCWDDGTDLEQTLRTLNDLVRNGKVRYIGASNVVGWQLQKIVDYAKFLGLEQIVSLQPQYNLLCRHTEWELQDICSREGLSMLSWGPLKGGLLSGKYQQAMDVLPEDTRLGWSQKSGFFNQAFPSWSEYQQSQLLSRVLKTLSEIANQRSRSLAQVAVRWLLQRKSIDSVVIGVTSKEQLLDNLDAASNWSLTDDEMSKLCHASDIPIPYPYEQVWRCNKPRI